MVQAADVRVFVAAIWLLAIGNTLALVAVFGMSRCALFVALNCAAALWYALYRRRGMTHALVLHLKYPVFVVLLAPSGVSWAALAIPASLVYLALLAFELLDTAREHDDFAPGVRYLPFLAVLLGLAFVTFGGVP